MIAMEQAAKTTMVISDLAKDKSAEQHGDLIKAMFGDTKNAYAYVNRAQMMNIAQKGVRASILTEMGDVPEEHLDKVRMHGTTGEMVNNSDDLLKYLNKQAHLSYPLAFGEYNTYKDMIECYRLDPLRVTNSVEVKKVEGEEPKKEGVTLEELGKTVGMVEETVATRSVTTYPVKKELTEENLGPKM